MSGNSESGAPAKPRLPENQEWFFNGLQLGLEVALQVARTNSRGDVIWQDSFERSVEAQVSRIKRFLGPQAL